jgi:hydroxyacylglutathione hydrolase
VEHGLPVERVEQLSVHELYRRLVENAAVQVLDVRMDSEWQEGHIEDALHQMLGDLPTRLDSLGLQPARPVAVVCGSGYRSSIATSLLKRHGFRAVWDVLGGMTAWSEAGYPVVEDEAPGRRTAEDLRVRDLGQHLVRRTPAAPV